MRAAYEDGVRQRNELAGLVFERHGTSNATEPGDAQLQEYTIAQRSVTPNATDPLATFCTKSSRSADRRGRGRGFYTHRRRQEVNQPAAGELNDLRYRRVLTPINPAPHGDRSANRR